MASDIWHVPGAKPAWHASSPEELRAWRHKSRCNFRQGQAFGQALTVGLWRQSPALTHVSGRRDVPGAAISQRED